MTGLRLFVALIPPATVRAELGALAPRLDGAQPTPGENIHLTLRFIGETKAEKQANFESALAQVQVQSFILPVQGVGIFPLRGPAKVLWAGVGRGHTRLFQLRKQVDEALLSVEPGLAMPGFHPHFTLGRLTPTEETKPLAQFLKKHANFEAPPFRITEFYLLASDLRSGQLPEYKIVRQYSLLK